jgi:NTP pyrophosphatase (non-canonical NTP hydrolase)
MTDILSFSSYQKQALSTDQRKSVDASLGFPLLGLFGETGSLLSEVKKKQRDPVAYTGYQNTVLEELGDVLWYLTAVADRANIDLELLASNIEGNLTNWNRSASGLSFADLREPLLNPKNSPSIAFEKTLLRLAAEVGLLVSDYETGWLDNNRDVLSGRLIAILRTLQQAANEAGVTLHSAAKYNLEKIFDRWPVERKYPALFDEEFPESEQFPRTLVVDIEEIDSNGRKKAQLKIAGQKLGDNLTDNREDDDDYRFHDVFHLSYAAFLGWSPNMRRLLKVKRKSKPMVDEVQDGARAVLIEEGIATWIFNHAEKLNLFENVASLDYGLLKSVRQFVTGYEAEVCPLWMWETAILEGYRVFRLVKHNRGGRITADLNRNTLSFDKL